jgi:hypothetical protein
VAVDENNGVRNVTVLMMIRAMPEADFRQLCDLVLCDDTNITTVSNNAREDSNPEPLVCELCGLPIEDADAMPLIEACKRGCGVQACKACIDLALAHIFGVDENDPEIIPLARDIATRAVCGHG